MADPDWIDTPGLTYLLGELVPKAAELLKLKDISKPILLVGPTGTGKTHIKNRILEKANLSSEELHINCAALSPGLIESQLFGHQKGSFSGAIKDHPGFFGSEKKVLVFDEIGTLLPHLQAKLLTVIETGEYFSIGAVAPTVSTKKILAMTNEAIHGGVLKPDLVYRFHVINVPGLHARRQDIPYLLQRLVPGMEWACQDLLRLMAYNWPGNVRT